MTTETALLDIKLPRLLDQLYITRSVTRSAEALGQSQPTVSIWLARLRKELGDPLFVRAAEGMLPTPRTDALMGSVREVLDGLQRLAQAAAPFDPATAQRRFSICMTDASHITLLPRLLAHVRALAPGVVLEAKRIDAGLLRHIDETLARSTGLNGLRVLPCPFEIPGFTVKQYWHARYHHDADSRWLRGICAELFMNKVAPLIPQRARHKTKMLKVKVHWTA